MSDELLKTIQDHVQRHVDQYLPRFQGLINTVEDELDTNIQQTPSTVRMMMYEVIFMELLAKIVAGGAVTFNHPLDKATEGVIANFRKIVEAHYIAVKASVGGHNVHANSVGEELPSDKPNV